MVSAYTVCQKHSKHNTKPNKAKETVSWYNRHYLLPACVIKYQHLSKLSLAPQRNLDNDLMNVLLFLNLNTSSFTSLNVTEGVGVISCHTANRPRCADGSPSVQFKLIPASSHSCEASECSERSVTEKPTWKLLILPS